MLSKNQRILWLLNHKTLMPFEIPVMLKLGFEVFTPKKIPKKNFRSGAIDFSYDSSLTIPKKVLTRLNQFDFYETVWPAEIVSILNRYFGTVFIIPHAQQVVEALAKFEGRIVFRTFGLDNTQTYKNVLQDLYGYQIFEQIHKIGGRFWFGEGYEQLHECEPPLLANRAVYLPIGLPGSFWKNADKWTGVEKKILFVCPNAVTNPYYANVYKDFKRDFGDLPHVIVGAQDVEVNDPNMLGFVSDDELERLYLECKVFYYHSTELRHVHYSPIEAAINGMPVIFFKESLLGRMAGQKMHGQVGSVEKARNVIQEVLNDNLQIIQSIRHDQRSLARQFSAEYCVPAWEQAFLRMGLDPARTESNPFVVLGRELVRSALLPLAKGKSGLRWRRVSPAVPRSMLRMPFSKEIEGSIEDGIDFRDPKFPSFVLDVEGISGQEFWGRWTDGKKVRILLDAELKGEIELLITGGGYGKNIGTPFSVKIGKDIRRGVFFVKADLPETIALTFSLRKPSNLIEITVPYPVQPPNDLRNIGLGLVQLKVVSGRLSARHN